MDPRQFKMVTTGELVQITGIQGSDFAFVPAPLPPQWSWPVELWPLLMDAREALASLNGIGSHLPNPDLILRPLQFREAVRSSSLEGTVTQPQQQALFELDPAIVSDAAQDKSAYLEISNYARALRYYFDGANPLPLSLRLIRDLHEILMMGGRGADKEPGRFRRLQVQIGQPPRYVPPPPQHLNECLSVFEQYLHAESSYNPLVNAFLVHYQFEAIHPFRDGNGRVGRLLLSIMIAEQSGASLPWLHMSAYFDANRDEYIDRLFRISTEGDWHGWIEFCLRGVLVQAKDTQDRCIKLVALMQRYRDTIASIRGRTRLGAIVDGLFDTPVVQIPYLAKKYVVRYATANADVDKLVEAGILVELPDIRQKTYICSEILNMIYS